MQRLRTMIFRFAAYFTDPELALIYVNGKYGSAVGTLLDLRLDTNSLGAGFDFRNGKDGLFGLKRQRMPEKEQLSLMLAFRQCLLQKGSPRSVRYLLPIFYTGAPNLAPYPTSNTQERTVVIRPWPYGKPFIHKEGRKRGGDFLPTLGDMLRLNMAVPVTARNDVNFSSEGLIQAAAIGLTVAPFNTSAKLENIPNMDGFPNGRKT